MTPLRQRMLEDMQLRGMAPATQEAYLRYVRQLAEFTGKSPDQVTDEDFRQFFLALHKIRGLSRSSATVAIAAFKFLFEVTLQRPWPRHCKFQLSSRRFSSLKSGTASVYGDARS